MGVCLNVSDLSIGFGGIKAVDNLSFNINEGEIYGLIGPNGAGKTTVFNCITQFYKPDTGKVIFNNREGKEVNLVELKTHQIISQGLVRTFQNIELIGNLSILDNVLVGSHIEFKTGFFSHGFKLKKSKNEEMAMREKAEKYLKLLDIYDIRHEYAGGQPYGVLKSVELCRALMSEPKLMILDEPAAGLNDTETLELSALLKKIRDELQCTILLVEHDMRLIMDVCDRICAISFGKKLAEGTKEEIKANKQVQEAYLGKEDVDE